MSDKKYVISVDGGGTKTKFCVKDIETNKKTYFSFGSTNYKVVGIEETEKNLINAYNEVFQQLRFNEKNIVGMVLGLSGFDTPKDYDVYNLLVDKMNIERKKVYICNDSELAFYSMGELPGMVIVAGTGSIAYGMNVNNKCRVGGWGSPISDLGSGCWIGIEVLRDLLRYCDNYLKFEEVFEEIKKFCHADSYKDLPFIVSSYQNNDIALIAKIVCEYAIKGDPYSKNVIYRATNHIAEMGKSVYKKMKFEKEKNIDVVLAGSLFKSEIYKEGFKEHFIKLLTNNNINFKLSVINPVDGGLILALKKFYNFGNNCVAKYK